MFLICKAWDKNLDDDGAIIISENVQVSRMWMRVWEKVELEKAV